MKIDRYKALFVKNVINYEKDVSDLFGDFKFYLKISKCYTLSGRIWRVEVPNLIDHDKDLWRLLSRVFQYVHDKGCKYDRLESELMRKGIWKSL